MSNRRAFEEEEEVEGVIYVRCIYKQWYYWVILDEKLPSSAPKICDSCGAKAYLPRRLARSDKFSLHSSVALVGSTIYEFGGVEVHNDGYVPSFGVSKEVAYIDTAKPDQGWTLCKNKMLFGVEKAYTLTLNDGRVLVMGGYSFRDPNDKAFIQMYNPDDDTWKALGSYNSTWYTLGGDNKEFNPCSMDGHAVLDDRTILMHDSRSPMLFYYDVLENFWRVYWGPEFGAFKESSTFVDGIYYVLDKSVLHDDHYNPSLFLSGYDIKYSKPPKRLPVKVVVPPGYDKKEVLGLTGGVVPSPYLLSLGNNKVAMVWHYTCEATPLYEKTMIAVWCSTFKMIKKYDGSGELQLEAHVLSNCCYHVDGHKMDSCLAINPSKQMGVTTANPDKKMKMTPVLDG